jgi:hypothetical protein
MNHRSSVRRDVWKPAGAFCGVVAVTACGEQATFRALVLLSPIGNSLIAHELICRRAHQAVVKTADRFV